MPTQSKLSAILATGRISNLPTVWCNVLVAFLIIQFSALHFGEASCAVFPLTLFIASCIGASCLYVGGCFLGDAVDVEFDLAHKPTRPIPMGILMRETVYTWASILLTTGIILPNAYLYFSTESFQLTPLIASLALAGVIIAYSIWHKRSPWFGLPLIGACRYFLIIFGACVAIASTGDCSYLCKAAVFATAVGIYTVCFASVARSESSPKPITWRKFLISVMLLLPLTALYGPCSSCLSLELYYPVIAALVIYWLWMGLAFRKINTNKGQFVSMSLAGFCLLDACFASFFGWPALIICLILFVSSLILQKWAPAT
jgi:4-hydroxybenzoate polyprenyltransferase